MPANKKKLKKELVTKSELELAYKKGTRETLPDDSNDEDYISHLKSLNVD